MHHRLLCHDKVCANLHCGCPQHQGCCNPAPICNSSRCNDWDGYCIGNLRNENHRRVFSDMSPRLRTFCHNRICAAPFHSLCQRDGCHNWNNFDARILPQFHIFFRISCAGRHNLHTFFRHDFRYFIGIWTHQHNVDSKRLLCSLFHLPDLLPHPFSRRARCSDQSQTSGFGYSGCKMMLCNPCHSSLKNRIFNFK